MKRVEFPIPPGLTVPENKQAGDEFDSLATFRIKDNGKTMCLVAIGDTQVPGYEEHEDGGKEVARKYNAVMKGESY